ncbi:MAG TPA: Ig-like domain-containing protein [Candidatus Didemnitutus sp.]|jgi:hypothetical protein
MNSKILQIALAVIGLAFSSGCQSFNLEPSYPADTGADLTRYKNFWNPDDPDFTKALGGDPSAIKKVVYGRLNALDINYRGYKEALYKESKTYRFGSESTVLALSAMGTIGAPVFNGTSVKIFAASSGFLSGLDSSFEKEAYYSQTLPLIISTMDSTRLVVRQQIDAMFAAGKTPELNEALNYVEGYYSAGSIATAIGVLTNTMISSSSAGGSTAAPVVVTIDKPADKSTVKSNGNVDVSASAKVASGNSVAFMSIFIDNGAQPVRVVSGQASIDFTIPAATVTDGKHTVTVSALDAQLHTATATATFTASTAPPANGGGSGVQATSPGATSEASQLKKSVSGVLGLPLQ